MQEHLKKLRTKAWRTSSARYNVSRRLKRREFFSMVSLSLFSAAIIAVAFVQRIYVIPGSHADDLLTTISASLGLFILVLGLVEWASSSGTKAEILFRNAEELNDFQQAIGNYIAKSMQSTPPQWNPPNDWDEKYARIRLSCTYNHEPIDDDFFRVKQRNADEFVTQNNKPCFNLLESLWISLKWHLSGVLFYVLCWGGVIGLAYFCHTVEGWK